MSATVANVKLRLEIAALDVSLDTRLALSIADAETIFKARCTRDDVPDGAAGTIERLAALLYTRDSSGNVQSETLGDHSVQNYVMGADLPDSITDMFRVYRKMKAL